jgi:hypothetical protein
VGGGADDASGGAHGAAGHARDDSPDGRDPAAGGGPSAGARAGTDPGQGDDRTGGGGRAGRSQRAPPPPASAGAFLDALRAEAHAAAGQAEAGLGVLAEALALVDHTGERYWEAEVYRLKGDLLLRQSVPDAPQAEACFQQALAVACRQQAKSWELRAAMSLSRLWQQQGKRAEARELLAPIYSWFTEGFDTPDLQEAKALLEELGT